MAYKPTDSEGVTTTIINNNTYVFLFEDQRPRDRWRDLRSLNAGLSLAKFAFAGVGAFLAGVVAFVVHVLGYV